MAKKRTSRTKKNADRQGEKPSYGKPPVEHQFKPGESGNPNGPPRHRVNLWVWLSKYMAMTQAELDGLDREKLTAAQRTALKLVEKAMDGERSGAERMARYCIDRDEGRAVERVIIGECEELARLLRGAWDEGQETRHDADSNP
jgi:hypothetical protein